LPCARVKLACDTCGLAQSMNGVNIDGKRLKVEIKRPKGAAAPY
jgi:hypothetical protein